ncbi:MAG: LysM peptidoglycan-binding domain-containing protein [Chloroflexi bacterium]|nr:LysM peptidoglycan-binding domain-containing protein [Chloroflexota bacterium]
MNDHSENRPLANLIIAVIVMFTVVIALLLAQLDSLTIAVRPSPQPVAQTTLQAITLTPMPIIILPSSTAVSSPDTIASATPTPPQSTAVAVVPDCSIPAGWQPYVVQPGDTLYSLSIRSGVSADTIVQGNCLTMTSLTPGSVIYLPAAPPPPPPPCGPPAHWVRYTVQYGDTLYALAQRTGSTVYAIMQANCMTSTTLYAGQTIYLRVYPVVPTMPPPLPSATPLPTMTMTAVPTNTAIPPATSTMPPMPTATTTAVGTLPPTSPVPTQTPSITPSASPTGQPTTTITPTLAPPTPTATIPGYPPPPTLPATIPPYP